MILRGLPVLTTMPEFSSPPTIAPVQTTDRADLSQAPKVVEYLGRPLHTFAHIFKFPTRAQLYALEDFVDALAGQWGELWMPSWHAELAPRAAISAGDSTVRIAPVGYATKLDPTDPLVEKLGHHIFIMDTAGNFGVRRVLTAAVVGADEVLTLGSSVGVAMALGQFFIGFVYCVRLASDTLAPLFDGPEVSSTTLSFMEVAQATDLSGADSGVGL